MLKQKYIRLYCKKINLKYRYELTKDFVKKLKILPYKHLIGKSINIKITIYWEKNIDTKKIYTELEDVDIRIDRKKIEIDTLDKIGNRVYKNYTKTRKQLPISKLFTASDLEKLKPILKEIK